MHLWNKYFHIACIYTFTVHDILVSDHWVVCMAETPLTLAVQTEPGGGENIRILVMGGAHIDFRAKDGLTPLHKAVRTHRHTALLVISTSRTCTYD